MSPGSPASPVSPPSGGRAVAGEEHPPLELPDVAAMREGWPDRKEGEDGGGSGSGSGRGDEELLSALLMWCQAVCHGYGVPVRNFTTSFADGRALCLLLHYYHPRVRGRERRVASVEGSAGAQELYMRGDAVSGLVGARCYLFAALVPGLCSPAGGI